MIIIMRIVMIVVNYQLSVTSPALKGGIRRNIPKPMSVTSMLDAGLSAIV
jgi:hypothetical protein